MAQIKPLMRLVSMDLPRSRNIPHVIQVKPEHFLKELDRIRPADGVLFPPYWLVNPLVFGLGKRIFPSLSTYLLGHSKIEMTRVFQAVCPDQTPQTLILPNTPARREEIIETFPFPFVMKEPVSARGLGVRLIEDKRQFETYCDQADALYAQEYLPIRRDLRVVVVGNRVIASYWREAASGAFLNNLAQGGRLDFEGIPPLAVRLVERIARKLKIDHAGFDIAEVDGLFYILEFNPLFGLAGLLACGIDPVEPAMAYLAKKWIRSRRPKTPPFFPKIGDDQAA